MNGVFPVYVTATEYGIPLSLFAESSSTVEFSSRERGVVVEGAGVSTSSWGSDVVDISSSLEGAASQTETGSVSGKKLHSRIAGAEPPVGLRVDAGLNSPGMEELLYI